MWRWIKHWHDWVMSEIWPFSRLGSQQALHYSYEKGGLKVDNQPVPWNAEAVLVEAIVRLPSSGRTRADFTLHIPDREPLHPESMRRTETNGPFHVFFRLPPLTESTTVELQWRNQKKGELVLPFLSRDTFLKSITLQMPTLAVNLGQQSVACQSFVSTQSKGLMATALLTSSTALVPLLDLKLNVEFRSERSHHSQFVPLQMSSSQLQGKQALLTACPHKFPRRIGPWIATWYLENEPLASQRIKAVSKRTFERSLRISETRYLVQDKKGEVRLLRQPPEITDIVRLGPCFLVSSKEIGMAGLCTLQTRAIIPGAVQPPLLLEHEVLITDGPTPFAPGTLNIADLQQVTGFELCIGNRSLGILPMTPAPTAKFNSEGGFQPTLDFTWSSAAEDQLAERLSRLMDGGPNGK